MEHDRKLVVRKMSSRDRLHLTDKPFERSAKVNHLGENCPSYQIRLNNLHDSPDEAAVVSSRDARPQPSIRGPKPLGPPFQHRQRRGSTKFTHCSHSRDFGVTVLGQYLARSIGFRLTSWFHIPQGDIQVSIFDRRSHALSLPHIVRVSGSCRFGGTPEFRRLEGWPARGQLLQRRVGDWRHSELGRHLFIQLRGTAPFDRGRLGRLRRGSDR